jgi:hypothetical protein
MSNPTFRKKVPPPSSRSWCWFTWMLKLLASTECAGYVAKLRARSLAIPSHRPARGSHFLHLQIRDFSTPPPIHRSIRVNQHQSPWRWKQYIPPKHKNTDQLHGAESKRPSTDVSTNVDTTRTPYLTIIMQFPYCLLLSTTRRPINKYRIQILGYKPVTQQSIHPPDLALHQAATAVHYCVNRFPLRHYEGAE